MSKNNWKTIGTQAKTAAVEVPSGSPLALMIWTATMGLVVFATLIGALHAAPRPTWGVAGSFREGDGSLQILIPVAQTGGNAWIQNAKGKKQADCTVRAVDARVVDLECRGIGAVGALFSTRAAVPRLPAAGPSEQIRFGTWLNGYRSFPFRLNPDLLAPLGGPKPRRVALR